jgi:hypothetical protein
MFVSLLIDCVFIFLFMTFVIVKHYASVYDMAIVCCKYSNEGKNLSVFKVLADANKIKVILCI